MATIEFVTVANHAEALNGLLYLSGGGWTDVRRAVPQGAPPPVTHFGIAISVLVPWNETNQQHHLVFRLEPEDGGELVRMEADLEMGRPPGLPAGSDQRAVLAINADIQFPAAGGYRVVAELGEQVSATSFRVHDGPPTQMGPTTSGTM